MHALVAKIFPAFSEKFEGRVLWPYLDVEGLPTVGIGCLINPIALALPLPWKLLDGSRATPLQVTAEWEYLKHSVELAHLGARAAEHATHLRLTDADVDALLEERMARNEAVLAAAFKGWADYPADAQLAIHSMAWAMGAGFAKEFPHFRRAVEAGEWEKARLECTIAGESSNAGLIPRNIANRICFANAARVIANPIALRVAEPYWPLELTT
jgi:GH24 family phage-related lysozyme (muramidase)